MAKSTVIWTSKAKKQLKEILEYWQKANLSKTFSKKLFKLFKEETELIAKFPNIGKETEYPNVRYRVVRNYLLSYTVEDNKVFILSIWDGRRNPELIELK